MIFQPSCAKPAPAYSAYTCAPRDRADSRSSSTSAAAPSPSNRASLPRVAGPDHTVRGVETETAKPEELRDAERVVRGRGDGQPAAATPDCLCGDVDCIEARGTRGIDEQAEAGKAECPRHIVRRQECVELKEPRREPLCTRCRSRGRAVTAHGKQRLTELLEPRTLVGHHHRYGRLDVLALERQSCRPDNEQGCRGNQVVEVTRLVQVGGRQPLQTRRTESKRSRFGRWHPVDRKLDLLGRGEDPGTDTGAVAPFAGAPRSDRSRCLRGASIPTPVTTTRRVVTGAEARGCRRGEGCMSIGSPDTPLRAV